jgi:hypothetical protein
MENMFNFESLPNIAPLLLNPASGEPSNPLLSATPQTALHARTLKRSTAQSTK